ncbi:MAG: outer membrane protein assembly factor BamE precursor [Pseudomonadota bacterium]|jgi:outer membrane protein assembly factor BamE
MKKHTFISLRSYLTLGLVTPLLLGLLSACSVPRLNVSADAILYIPEVVQGNFVSREQKDFLKPGMSRLQVREVLGTPLVSSVFHEDRWDYVFTIRRQGVAPQNFSLSVWFKGELLDRVTGDDLPSETEFVTKLVVQKSNPKVPLLEAKDEDLRKYPAPVRKAEPAPAPAAALPATYPPLEPATR